MALLSVFRKLWIFCGSSLGSRPVYREMAAQLGQILARNGIELVYGGRHVGLMGAVADAALGAHAKPCGVLNTYGYYEALLVLFDHGGRRRFREIAASRNAGGGSRRRGIAEKPGSAAHSRRV